MSKAQTELMRRCIAAVRRREVARGTGDMQLDRFDTELVEVGRINGVTKRTADSLVEAGLLVRDMPSWTDQHTATHVRLPRLDEMEGFV